ncbi:MAG: O-antigen ligase family protein [Verrucomicrobiota bacterium]|nr:O-antigen ligase family protein [Verrucomicrobiota bacterium]
MRALRGSAKFGAAVLVLAALGYLQTLNYEKDLLASLEAYLAIGLATILALVVSRDRSPANLSCLATAALFFGYIIARAITSAAPYAARFDLYLAVGTLVTYALFASAFTSSQIRVAVISTLLAFGAIHVLVGVVQAGFGENLSMLMPSLADFRTKERGTGFFVDPDHLAGLLELVGALGLGVASWSRRPAWVRVLLGYLTIVCYFGLVLTGSRGGYLGALASILTFILLSLTIVVRASSRSLVRTAGTGLLLVVIASAATWFLVQKNAMISSRVDALFTVDPERPQLWQAAVEQWKLDPTFGTGGGTYPFYARQLRAGSMEDEPSDVHNDYLHLLCEYGVVGVLAFGAFFFAHARHAWRVFAAIGPRRVAQGGLLSSDRVALTIGAFAAMAAYAVHSAVDFNLHIPANALIAACIFGMLANLGRLPHLEAMADEAKRMRTFRLLSAGLAAILIIQAARLIPGEYYAEQARVALRDENPNFAIALARQALTYEKRNPNIYFYLARGLSALAFSSTDPGEQNDLYERAVVIYDQARRLAPLDGTYPLDIAFLYDRLGRFEEAEWMYFLAHERNPHSPTVAGLYQSHLEAWESGSTAITP